MNVKWRFIKDVGFENAMKDIARETEEKMAYKLAVIGMGGMGFDHIRTIRNHIPEIVVIGGYDIREEANELARQKGLKVYESPEALYSDKDIDIVVIATPNDVHKDYCIGSLNAGKHVICEKPVTMNAEELEEIMEAEKKSGKIFTIHQNRRWDADYLTIKKILADGILKNPFTIKTSVHGSRMLFGWRAFKPNGGGLLLDWGVHLIDQLLDLIPQKVVSVYGHLHQVSKGEVDDCLLVNLRFESGLLAIVDISTNSFVPEPRWRMYCEDGTAIINPNWDLTGKIVKLADPSIVDWEDAVVYTLAGPTHTMLPRPKDTTAEIDLPEVDRGTWHYYYRNIVDVLDQKAELVVTSEQALRVMKIIDAVFVSDRTKAAITDVI